MFSNFQYAYLLGDLLVLPVWLILYFHRRDLRKEMLLASIFIGDLKFLMGGQSALKIFCIDFSLAVLPALSTRKCMERSTVSDTTESITGEFSSFHFLFYPF